MGPTEKTKIPEMKTLPDTAELMGSPDYKARFIAEYAQLKIRTNGLQKMVEKWDAGVLEFSPTCPRSTYDLQLRAMKDYMAVLEARAAIEDVDLSVIG